MNPEIPGNRVSIVVPVHNNSAQELTRCMDSILMQDYDNFEVIVVDDGSQNLETLNSLLAYQTSASVSIFHKANGGVASARNMGVLAASGDYVCFVDADDHVSPNMLRVLMAGMDKTVAIVLGGYAVVDHNGLPANVYEGWDTEKEIDSFEGVELLLRLQVPNISGTVCRTLFRLSFLKEFNISFDEELVQAEDFDFLLSIFASGARARLSNKTVYFYCANPLSQTRKHLQGKQLSMEKVNDRIRSIIDCIDLPNSLYNDNVANTAAALIGNDLLPGSNLSASQFNEHFKQITCSEPYRTAIRYISFPNKGLGLKKTVLLKMGRAVPSLVSRLLFACFGGRVGGGDE